MISWASFSRDAVQFPNMISLARLFVGLFIPLLVLQSSPAAHFFAAVIFVIGAFSDHWDGYFARKMNLVSDFGKYMDPLADKVFILGPLAAFAHLGYYSFWWIVPVFAREIGITFCRTGWLMEGSAIGAEVLGKYKLGLQVSLVSGALLTLNFSHYDSLQTAASVTRWLMMMFVYLAVFMTVLSGYTFLLSNRQHNLTPFFAKFTSAMGVGLIPFAPGTWGSVVGVALVLLAQIHGLVYFGVFVFIFWAGWWAVSRLDLSKEKDPSYVVVDETCGMMLALAGIPLGFGSVLAGFLLFRFFDIVKPFPLRRLEKYPGFWGIMLDDLGAGVYTWIILKIFWG